ncbi:uncharacterized protein LOC124834310 [Vigna umbellata]|uniref:uncharacterized protein LOC124834310 n=1 Tax=Vigna umbellata TaxID=87088 RepID=UPI001F5F66E1|nr:uncharacterized protein LOC124834310 [Vigna umbellata]
MVDVAVGMERLVGVGVVKEKSFLGRDKRGSENVEAEASRWQSFELYSCILWLQDNVTEREGKEEWVLVVVFLMATLSSIISLSYLPPLRRHPSLSPFPHSLSLSFSRTKPRSPFLLIASSAHSSDDFTSKSKKSVLTEAIQEIEPLDVSHIQKDVPPATAAAMKRIISGMLGLLPSDQFHVVIEALWEPLSKLLISSMTTGWQSFELYSCILWLQDNVTEREGKEEWVLVVVFLMATLSSIISLSYLPPLRRHPSLSPFPHSLSLSFSRTKPRSPFLLIASSAHSSDDFTSKSKKSVLTEAIQEIEPLDVSHIQKDVPPATAAAMKRIISGMLGLLPSDQFHVVIEALWEPLSKLLISSMTTGYVQLYMF